MFCFPYLSITNKYLPLTTYHYELPLTTYHLPFTTYHLLLIVCPSLEKSWITWTSPEERRLWHKHTDRRTLRLKDSIGQEDDWFAQVWPRSECDNYQYSFCCWCVIYYYHDTTVTAQVWQNSAVSVFCVIIMTRRWSRQYWPSFAFWMWHLPISTTTAIAGFPPLIWCCAIWNFKIQKYYKCYFFN